MEMQIPAVPGQAGPARVEKPAVIDSGSQKSWACTFQWPRSYGAEFPVLNITKLLQLVVELHSHSKQALGATFTLETKWLPVRRLKKTEHLQTTDREKKQVNEKNITKSTNHRN